jgi:hypothetical protein
MSWLGAIGNLVTGNLPGAIGSIAEATGSDSLAQVADFAKHPVDTISDYVSEQLGSDAPSSSRMLADIPIGDTPSVAKMADTVNPVTKKAKQSVEALKTKAANVTKDVIQQQAKPLNERIGIARSIPTNLSSSLDLLRSLNA